MPKGKGYPPKGRKKKSPKKRGKGVSHTAKKNARSGGKPARNKPRGRGY
ncbi:MAG: hypothetical protein GTO41_01490 [Burkholderiales bacterium]|nr:hypothetical protein [Burkholderiales bacterium]